MCAFPDLRFAALKSRDMPAKIHSLPTIILLLIIIGTYMCMCVCVYLCMYYISGYIYISEYRKSYIQFTFRSSLSGGLLTIIIKHVTRYVFFFYTAYIISFNKQCPCKKRRRDWRRDCRSFLSSRKSGKGYI